MATKCSDPAVLAGLFLAAYSGNLADVKSALKNNALSADVADPEKVRECVNVSLSLPPSFSSVLSALRRRTGAGSSRIEKPDQFCTRLLFFFSLSPRL